MAARHACCSRCDAGKLVTIGGQRSVKVIQKARLEPSIIAPPRRLPRHILELDGIRAIAIWMVLVLHVFVPDEESSRALSRFPRALLLIMGHGWLGEGSLTEP